jgi:hypothetical protein
MSQRKEDHGKTPEEIDHQSTASTIFARSQSMWLLVL